MSEAPPLAPRYCLHVLTVSEDGTEEVAHTWFDGGASDPSDWWLSRPASHPRPPNASGYHIYSDSEGYGITERTKAGWEERHGNYLKERWREDSQRKRASESADAFLKSKLTPKQLKRYEQDGEVEVIGSHSGYRYIIGPGTTANVNWYDGKKFGGKLCAHPTFDHCWLPHASVVLAQMLAITTDEPAFVMQANVYDGRRPRFSEKTELDALPRLSRYARAMWARRFEESF